MADTGNLFIKVSLILKRLCILLANEISLAQGAKNKHQDLKKTFDMILAVMNDAEKQGKKSETLRLWLEELKDIAYEAEDILDEHSYEVIRRCGMIRKGNRVSNFFSTSNSLLFPDFRQQIACEIQNINKKLNKHAMHINILVFQRLELSRESGLVDLDEISKLRKLRETVSIVDQSLGTIGRDDDKSNIINMLLPYDPYNQNGNIQVIPIVGMGGLGKSTLAQLIYNDDTVNNHFELKMWVCVSDDFDVKKLFMKMIESLTGQTCDGMSNIDVIACQLQQRLWGKRYLLVLDDVWNEEEDAWVNLRKPLLVGDSGSKIIVTTRSDTVASIIDSALYSYKLGVLDEDQGWSLFRERTFGNSGAAIETPILRAIGKELVQKLGGLPLALIFLSRLLRKKDENEWRIINENKFWVHSYDGTGILSILKLSYEHLPFHLKQCFSYFSLFDKDYTFCRKNMILMWMAEGFLCQPSRGINKSMEKIGNEYFNSLLQNSFFQDVKKDIDGEVYSFKFHALIHDLAIYVAGDHECLVARGDEDKESILSARRLRLLGESEWHSFDDIMAAFPHTSKLRTLLVSNESIMKLKSNVFDGMKRLRVLDLHEAPNIREIPSSLIDNLKHLRYLDLSGTKITTLPESVMRLFHLQTLKLHGCVRLKQLPKGMGKLINLRHLFLPKDINMRLKQLPKGMGKLINLRHLFLPKDINMPREIEQLSSLQTLQLINVGIVGDDFGGIEILEGLNLLDGEIVINHLRNVTSGLEAQRANLKGKKNLNKIYLNWHTADVAREDDYSEYNEDGAVLEALEPHPNLKLLAIDQYFGARLPRWVGDPSCVPNLTNLQLSHCTKCEQLVEFGKLPSLKELRLLNMDGIKFLGNEFYYNNSGGGGGVGSIISSSAVEVVLFPSLKELTLHDMGSLEEWVDIAPSTPTVSYSCFPCLEKIVIKCCPNLRITPTYFPCLKELTLQEINERVVVPLITTNQNSLFSVELEKIPELNFLPRSLLQYSLCDLKVMDCLDFHGFLPNEEEEAEFSISLLSLVNLPVMEFLPDIRSFISLECLYIEDCESLKPSPEDLTCLSSCLEHLKEVVIENVKEVEDFKWEN